MHPGVILTCLLTAGLADLADKTKDRVKDDAWRRQAWKDWKHLHGKRYMPFEESRRRFVFYHNLQKVQDHNCQYPVTVSYTRGLNHFSDMTAREYRNYNRLFSVTHRVKSTCSSKHAHESSPLPKTVDWRTKGYVTHVKNQGQCGSCWAFSTTGSTEGQHFKKTGTLLSLSEQQLVDCSQAQGNQGCDGGLMDQGFAYIMSQPGGLETELDYPYTAKDGNCTAMASKEQAKVSGCVDVESGSEEALKHAVATVGPISVAIDASHNSFQSYSSGVYYEPECSSTELDHGVLVVGYGTYQGQDYWLVKNSWSQDWGMNGYIMMARNRGNNCGIATDASYPTV